MASTTPKRSLDMTAESVIMRAAGEGMAAGLTLQQWREVADRAYLALALVAKQGNQCATARDLGVHRNTLRRTLRKYRVEPKRVVNGRRKSNP